MPESVAVLLVGGHESADAAQLARLRDAGLDAVPTAPGRGLHDRAGALLDEGMTVVVVPMTFGRDATMVADAAKTLKWLAPGHPGRLALAAPFGTPDHLNAWLRTAANRARGDEDQMALIVQIPSSNPFDEAEMHRIAYLVATHGALAEVAVSVGDASATEATAERLRRLGYESIVVVPAGFAAEPALAAGSRAVSGGALMTDAAIIRTVRTRVSDALAALARGEDGIDAGLMADHGHGYAHSHAFEEGQSHSHGHSHPHPHGHSHPHEHAHGDDHDHPHEHSHDDLGHTHEPRGHRVHDPAI